MKKIILLIAIVAFAGSTFCQQLTTEKTKEYYLQRSQVNKNVGWVLLAGGSSMILTGLIIDDNSSGLDFTGVTIAGIGIAGALGSIPFFVISSAQARKAATVNLDNQELVVLRHAGVDVKSHPAITLRIRLR